MCIASVCVNVVLRCVVFVLIVAFFLRKPICDEVHILTHAFTGREEGIQFIETQTAWNNSSNLYTSADEAVVVTYSTSTH